MPSSLRNASVALAHGLRRFIRRDTPQFASFMSLAACVFLAAISLVIGRWEHSLIVQTNGFISLIDIGNSILFLAAVDRSTRSADHSFNYGYGKYESLAILVSANLIIVLTVVTVVQAIGLLQQPTEGGNSYILLGWSGLAFLVMRQTARRLERYANRFHQPMLRYDAELWRVDSWVELCVITELVVSGLLRALHFYGIAAVLDATASVVLMLITLKVPLQHGAEAFNQLTDRTLPAGMQAEILAIIGESKDKICELQSVHTRQSGRDIFIEIDIIMPASYTLSELYPIEREILVKLRERFPTAIPRVYVTPCEDNCRYRGLSGSCSLSLKSQQLPLS